MSTPLERIKGVHDSFVITARRYKELIGIKDWAEDEHKRISAKIESLAFAIKEIESGDSTPDDEMLEAADLLHTRLAGEVGILFGVSYQVYREFKIARNEWEWTILTRLFGRRARFDVSIPANDVGKGFGLDHLLAQLTYQVMDAQEAAMLHGDGPIFAIDRADTTGIANPEVIIHPPLVDQDQLNTVTEN